MPVLFTGPRNASEPQPNPYVKIPTNHPGLCISIHSYQYSLIACLVVVCSAQEKSSDEASKYINTGFNVFFLFCFLFCF